MSRTELQKNRGVAFCIRDDDISYFTQPWMLDKLYCEAWRRGFKVSLAVIPYIKGGKLGRVFRNLGNSDRFYPVTDNRELIIYLSEKLAGGYVDVVQHGCTHARENEKPEFATRDFRTLNEKLLTGNRLLREAFKRNIPVFVAPNERLSRAAWKSLSQNQMCLCRKFTMGRFILTTLSSSADFPKLTQAILRSPNLFKPISTSIIDLANVLVFQWSVFLAGENIEVQIEEAKKIFLKALGKKEPFIVAHHHWEFLNGWESSDIRQDRLLCFNSFLRFASSTDRVWKTTLTELCSWMKPESLSCH